MESQLSPNQNEVAKMLVQLGKNNFHRSFEVLGEENFINYMEKDKKANQIFIPYY